MSMSLPIPAGTPAPPDAPAQGGDSHAEYSHHAARARAERSRPDPVGVRGLADRDHGPAGGRTPDDVELDRVGASIRRRNPLARLRLGRLRNAAGEQGQALV